MVGPELHVAHELAGAFQQTIWIRNLRAAKEPDVDVSLEGVDVGERRIHYTCGGLAVMQHLSNVVAAIAHDLEPALRDRPQLTGMCTDPGFDRWMSPERAGKPEELAHGDFTPVLAHT